MNVLLSIKPTYVEEIINGNKKYEFRKAIFKNPHEIKKVFIYSSRPVKKIIGAFTIGKIVKGTPKDLWNQCGDFAGIGKEDFFSYFKNKHQGFAITIENLEIFSKPVDPYTSITDFKAPQSFCYIDNDFLELFTKNLADTEETNKNFNEKCGKILRMTIHIEDYLDLFISNYFCVSQDRKMFLLKDLIITTLNFDRKKNIFLEICKEEGIEKNITNDINEKLSFIQSVRNRIAHDDTYFYPDKNEITLLKRKSITYKRDELRITDDLVKEIDEKSLSCRSKINDVYLKIFNNSKEQNLNVFW
ncbi:hypothetical protein DU57_12315 [Methanosarcina mazei]|uniref:ASCH domain-containing protein n=3 Tax=Methanosarcina mazei TaxID=2209 RepID=A0A0F8I0A1_METMZ|nr:hypothetical protein [Methanosarcina mazei]AKB68573.1 50S ribosomal protein L22/unknown domain fusion protein [Methanosarcina mazei LYC]KKG82391.1 hypothetical protein DU57_12315 [Methanosarcina mazei]KKG87760.1 hypothetical protein DU59_07545 [Methanosarcina mazei]KKH05527.1 hypothetical protein DU42_12200 [Methanosarcina mazei]